MRVAIAALADAANVREGMLNVLSAGANTLPRPWFPAPLGVDLAFMLELDQEDLRTDHEIKIHIKIIGPGDQTLGEVEGELQWQASETWPQYVPAPIGLRDLQIPTVGIYEIRLSVADLDEIVLIARAVEISSESQ